jgi:hypothetical protein
VNSYLNCKIFYFLSVGHMPIRLIMLGTDIMGFKSLDFIFILWNSLQLTQDRDQ